MMQRNPLLNAAVHDPQGKKIAVSTPFTQALEEHVANRPKNLGTKDDDALLLSVPNLAANISGAVKGLMTGVNVVLAGGTALTLKHPATGRLGPASQNMRDLDFDLAVSDQNEFDKEYRTKAFAGPFNFLRYYAKPVAATVANVLPPDAKLAPPSPKVTTNNTLMCNYTDGLEISFHMDSLDADGTLGSGAVTASNGQTLNLIDTPSHLAMATSALAARLGRPDKLWKNLQDPLVLAASLPKVPREAAIQKVHDILAEPAADTGKAQQVLSGHFYDNTGKFGQAAVKTADGRRLWPATLFGHLVQKTCVKILGANFWHATDRRWKAKSEVAAESKAHYDGNFRQSYQAIVGNVVHDLARIAHDEKRTDWPALLPKVWP